MYHYSLWSGVLPWSHLYVPLVSQYSLSSKGQRARTTDLKHGMLLKNILLGVTLLTRALWAQLKAEFATFVTLLWLVIILLELPPRLCLDLLMILTPWDLLVSFLSYVKGIHHCGLHMLT